MPIQFTANDIVDYFDSGTYARGRDYARQGKVSRARMGDPYIAGEVGGSGGKSYSQSIQVALRRGRVHFDGDCDCPMDRNCKHVVAVLICCLDQMAGMAPPEPSEPALPLGLSVWLQQVQQLQKAVDGKGAPPAKLGKPVSRLMYVLLPGRSSAAPEVQLCKARVRPDESIASASTLNDIWGMLHSTPDFVKPADVHAMRMFVAMSQHCSLHQGRSAVCGETGASFIRLVRAAGCLGSARDLADLRTGAIEPIKEGPARDGGLSWRELGDRADVLRLDWHFADGALIDSVLPTEPPMYIANGLLGELILPAGVQALPIRELQLLAAGAPAVSRHDADALARQLHARGMGHLVPAPPVVQQVVRADIVPRPVLFLGSREVATPGAGVHWNDYAVLGFEYDRLRIRLDAAMELTRNTAAGREVIVRNAALEQAAHAVLAALGLMAPPAGLIPAAPGMLQLPDANDWLRFTRQDLPLLGEQGWLIEQDRSFRFDLAEVEDWYADVEEGAGSTSTWFDLELGIVVNGERVALLPVLLQLIRSAPHNFNTAALEAQRDEDLLIASLPGEVQVGLPWGRVKPILRTLGELFFTEQSGDSVRIPVLDAARLAELEAHAQLRWTGGRALLEMGRKLRAFSGVAKVAPPVGLQASLRPYQLEGVAWMQFLREYDLGGILADDMGLGKTIQTLAHILLEKEAGRLNAPALVVAPTSLMGNWQAEAARFAPGLRVLLLHGADRFARFAEIGRHDLVLTTYALLARDEAELRAQHFHLLILDESQYIKNSRAKAAQTAALLPARHRLCLTGTPLQNHLGELWAQFHFLMPGLLGDEKLFNATFRKPIEKLGDADRNAFLVRRIKPFLLRRTKDAVAKELPAKTEMVREVELSGAQRDLYETMRLAMDKKVRDAIASKGVARSQIIILDALLKLRQVCCDPRLVKLAGVTARGAPSAKLAELMEMVVELLDEGRKILVFSQFTSMLALIEAELQERAIAYALLTGSTVDRTGQVNAFQSGQVSLFLISLKAGGVGLNLTAADTVIHYDPWWNPAAENQATDRAWRIGQDKPVFVYKLIAKGTLEQKIQELQRKKSELADAVLAGGAAHDLALTQADLQAILAPLQ